MRFKKLARAALLYCIGITSPVRADNPMLDAEQLQAANIVVARPVRMTLPARVPALGLVLDPAVLTTDAGDLLAARAAEHAADAAAVRLGALVGAGGGASQKTLDAARAEQAKAHAERSAAAARYAQHWGPLATLAEARRALLTGEVIAGAALLVRADLPGRHLLGTLPRAAVLAVDGVQLSAHVLGALRQTSELQSAAVLLEVDHAPLGLGPGAHVEVALLSAPQTGVSLPGAALFYDEGGAFVFKRLQGGAPAGKTAFAAVKVSLLMPVGTRWLVGGIDDDDEVVVAGAGTLWSLQGVGAGTSDDDD